MLDTPYTNTCDNCGRTHTLFTQDDNEPECYTEVSIECSCGNKVVFSLPVN